MGFSWPSQKHRKSKVYNDSSKTFFICFFWAKYLILLSIRTAPLVVNHEESLKQHLIKKQQRKKILHKKQKGKQPSQNQSQQRMTARQKWRLQRKTIKTPSRTIKKYNHEKVKEMLQSNKRQRKRKIQSYRVGFLLVRPKSVRLHANPFKKVLCVRIS